ncbi:hypothetical protein BKA62DRAFT_714019 [Auriculariales sp. MPI-PUGE-AT-0066]|nr:hypothetical protein BKA62DRAFT_714019 [Auriculariales sp. MPI-PUGE-AT-0066]
MSNVAVAVAEHCIALSLLPSHAHPSHSFFCHGAQIRHRVRRDELHHHPNRWPARVHRQNAHDQASHDFHLCAQRRDGRVRQDRVARVQRASHLPQPRARRRPQRLAAQVQMVQPQSRVQYYEQRAARRGMALARLCMVARLDIQAQAQGACVFNSPSMCRVNDDDDDVAQLTPASDEKHVVTQIGWGPLKEPIMTVEQDGKV